MTGSWWRPEAHPRAWVAGLAALSAVTTGLLVVRLIHSDRPADTVLQAVEPSTPALVSTPDWPTPLPTLSFTALPSPPTVPTVSAQIPTATSPPALPALTPSPQRTEPADVRHDRLMHNTGIPAGCDASHACQYPGAIAANPGGPGRAWADVLGPHSIRVTWVNSDLDGWKTGPFEDGPVRSFYISAFVSYHTDWVMLREFPRTVTTATLTDVPAGRYVFCVLELNDSGLGSGYCTGEHDIPGEEPTPSADPAPSPTQS